MNNLISVESTALTHMSGAPAWLAGSFLITRSSPDMSGTRARSLSFSRVAPVFGNTFVAGAGEGSPRGD